MKVQVLYYLFEPTKDILKRLELSIKSLLYQNTKHSIEICIIDGSLYKTDLSYLDFNYRLYHNFLGTIINFGKLINQGFLNLIDQNFFFVSDADLIYPPNYIDYMIDNLDEEHQLIYYPVVRFNSFPYGNIDNKYNLFSLEKEILKNKNFDYYLNNNILMFQSRITENLPKTVYSSPAYIVNSRFFEKVQGQDENIVGWAKNDREFAYRTSFLTKNKVIEPYKENAYVYHLHHKSGYIDSIVKNNTRYLKYKASVINNAEDAMFYNTSSIRKEKI